MKFRYLLFVGLIVATFLYGLYLGVYKKFPYEQLRGIKHMLTIPKKQFGLTNEQETTEGLRHVNTSLYGSEPDTVAFLVNDDKAPLIVSLHSWSGNYLEPDPLASSIIERGFNYIHPNFQNSSNKENGCLSSKIISDIDSSIDWAIRNGSVNKNAIYVIGASGGGYTALGYASKSKHLIQHTFAWVPVTDLYEWYLQSLSRNSNYASEILGCTGGSLNLKELQVRSPINMQPKRSLMISLYAGIKDGYEGSVPISHSINYFNKFAHKEDRIGVNDLQKLLTRAYEPTEKTFGNRQIYIDKSSKELSLIIFDGGHEMLKSAAINEIFSSIEKK